jgi:hypothetical protein
MKLSRNSLRNRGFHLPADIIGLGWERGLLPECWCHKHHPSRRPRMRSWSTSVDGERWKLETLQADILQSFVNFIIRSGRAVRFRTVRIREPSESGACYEALRFMYSRTGASSKRTSFPMARIC